MGIFEKREAELDLKLRTDSLKAYDALLQAFGRAGLNVKSEDKAQLTAVAVRPMLKAMLSNSYGEVVTFTITEPESEDYCFVNLCSRGKAPMGSYSHKVIFQKIRESLQKDLGVEAVQAAVQGGDEKESADYSARTSEMARLEKLDGELLRAIGTNGVVVVFPNKIVILRIAGALTGILHGMKGDKEIWISKLASTQLRKPGAFTNGYIQFELMGGQSSQSGILDATHDENSVLFAPPDLEAFLQVKDLIENLISERETGILQAIPSIKSTATELKEWKELLDTGAITQTEYDTKKVELLTSG